MVLCTVVLPYHTGLRFLQASVLRELRRLIYWRHLNSQSPRGEIKQQRWGQCVKLASDKKNAREQQRLTWLVSLRAGVRFCSWMDWRRVIRNFLSSPSWTERSKGRWARLVQFFYSHLFINTQTEKQSCEVLHFLSAPVVSLWSSFDRPPPDSGSRWLSWWKEKTECIRLM